jgi:hypothetical protein
MDDLEQHVQALIMDVMKVLHAHGVTEINVGGLMRIIGVDNENAREHDDEVIELTEKFTKYLQVTTEDDSDSNTSKILH